VLYYNYKLRKEVDSMREITRWIADDGKEFDDEYDCKCHEWDLEFQKIKGEVKWFNNQFEPLTPSLQTDFAYATYVVVSSQRAAEVLHDFCYEEGYICPCDGVNGAIDLSLLGWFWWDSNQECWRNLDNEEWELTRLRENFQNALKNS
jgi:hypothetical protein